MTRFPICTSVAICIYLLLFTHNISGQNKIDSLSLKMNAIFKQYNQKTGLAVQ